VLYDFFRQNSEACLKFLAIVSERSSHIMERLEDLKFLNVEARLAKMLIALNNRSPKVDSAGCFSIVNQTELGLRIGATRESVNKWLHFFANEGWINYHSSSVRVLDEESLHRLAG
jgi:hypothetical protein